ncbi:outer membrane beta-barrel protein [Flammeovirga sp. EKP202]|uniref:outer membrane beta-barrel protein n=1 Tax=Flammeovirga sp. EKP202 TaxID=2770592 RepID=UPI00165F2B04|nr:outer membrane beta-barrel protein [Flammeovirga sp. EKP202]MBD0401570.1 outer membrane beta-barrel protein [Flammeovirga sp. EKP202]
MNRKFLILLTIGVLTFFANCTIAQENKFLFSYSNSQGVSDLRYLELNGFQLEWQYRFKKIPLSAGLSVGYHYSKDKEIVEIPVLYGVNNQQMTNVKSVPILAHIKYSFFESKYLKPYVGIGFGMYHQAHGIVINTFDYPGKIITKDFTDWHFGFAPEVGITTDLFPSIGTFISLKYNCIGSDNKHLNYNNVSFNFGIIF